MVAVTAPSGAGRAASGRFQPIGGAFSSEASYSGSISTTLSAAGHARPLPCAVAPEPSSCESRTTSGSTRLADGSEVAFPHDASATTDTTAARRITPIHYHNGPAHSRSTGPGHVGV